MKKLYSLISILFFALSVNAQTNVSGGIYANTTWTLAGSPYIVVDTVVVFPGVTLTIDPGVVVKFDSTKYLEIRQGTLIANGTATDSITFTANSLNPVQGSWGNSSYGGIYLNYNASTASFNYVNVRYSTIGIKYGGTITYIKNSIFTYNECGISNIYNTLVDSCIFKFNGSGMGYFNNTTVNFCNISNNTYGIERVSGGFISNCIIDSNQIGLGGNYGWFDYSKMFNCNISYNQIGVNADDGGNTIKNCIFNYNSVKGYNQQYGGNSADSIINCEFKFNGVGLRYTACPDTDFGQPASIITQCVIDNNNIGMQYGGCDVNQVFCNTFCNNTSYDFENIANSPLSIPYNYWCTADSDTVSMHLYDGYDDVSRGLVTFMPLDTNQCYLSGCNIQLSANVTNATCDTCTNGSATAIITNGFAPYSYTWYTSPIQYAQTATALSSGTYTVCVSDSRGCTACNYNIYVDSTNCTGFSVSATATNVSCSSCSDGTASATVTAGNPPYFYQWNTVPIQNTQTATSLTVGNYVVCVGDIYGCSACDTVTVGIGSCSSYYTIVAAGSPHTYDLTNMASGTPPLTYNWTWGDGSPNDTGAFPTHTYPTAGNYTICLSITDSAGCSDTYCNTFYLLAPSSTPVTVNVIPPVISGIASAKAEREFTIYPNPTSGDLTVQLQNVADATIAIYNTLGDKVYSAEIIKRDSYTVQTNFSSGIYFIEVNDGSKVSRERFVKQ
jgi:hypothetical protein